MQIRTRFARIILTGMVAVGMCAALSPMVYAAEVRVGETVRVGDTLGSDTYLAGSRLIVSAEITGDLVATGGMVSIDAPIRGDLIVMSGNVSINAPIDDDVRVGSGIVIIDDRIGGDVVAAGGSIFVTQDAIIEGDLIVATGGLLFDGLVQGTARIGAGEAVLNGTINGPSFISGDRVLLHGALAAPAQIVATTIELAEGTQVAGVRYWTKQGAIDFGPYLTSGEAVFDASLEPTTFDPGFGAAALWFMALSFLAQVFILLLFVLFTKKMIPDVAQQLQRYWMSFGIGLLYLVATPAVLGILAITLVGLPVALVGYAVYAFSVFSATAIAAFVFAAWIKQWRGYRWNKAALFGIALIILIVLNLIGRIPFVGWAALLLLVPSGIGSLLVAKWRVVSAIR